MLWNGSEKKIEPTYFQFWFAAGIETESPQAMRSEMVGDLQ